MCYPNSWQFANKWRMLTVWLPEPRPPNKILWKQGKNSCYRNNREKSDLGRVIGKVRVNTKLSIVCSLCFKLLSFSYIDLTRDLERSRFWFRPNWNINIPAGTVTLRNSLMDKFRHLLSPAYKIFVFKRKYFVNCSLENWRETKTFSTYSTPACMAQLSQCFSCCLFFNIILLADVA